jgi:hypothetical protein
VPANDVRLYPAEEVLSIALSPPARTFDPGQDDRRGDLRPRGQATVVWQCAGGGSALWLFAPTEDRADQLVGFLADCHYGSLRYYGDKGVKDVHPSAD